MNHSFKSQYAEIEKAYKKIIEEEKNVFDKDFKKAQEMYPELEKELIALENIFKMIHDNMSEFTAPGLAAALTNAIKVGLVGKKFVAGQAKMTLDKFFDR